LAKCVQWVADDNKNVCRRLPSDETLNGGVGSARSFVDRSSDRLHLILITANPGSGGNVGACQRDKRNAPPVEPGRVLGCPRVMVVAGKCRQKPWLPVGLKKRPSLRQNGRPAVLAGVSDCRSWPECPSSAIPCASDGATSAHIAFEPYSALPVADIFATKCRSCCDGHSRQASGWSSCWR
jgi:hypothetical protein